MRDRCKGCSAFAGEPHREGCVIAVLTADNARLRGEIQKWIHYYGLGSSPLFQRVEQAEARVAALEAALEEAYDLYDAGESAAAAYERGDLLDCRRQHERAEGIKERIRAALTELTPPAQNEWCYCNSHRHRESDHPVADCLVTDHCPLTPPAPGGGSEEGK